MKENQLNISDVVLPRTHAAAAFRYRSPRADPRGEFFVIERRCEHTEYPVAVSAFFALRLRICNAGRCLEYLVSMCNLRPILLDFCEQKYYNVLYCAGRNGAHGLRIAADVSSAALQSVLSDILFSEDI